MKYRIMACVVILLVLLLLWAELAVGVFGTPFSGQYQWAVQSKS